MSAGLFGLIELLLVFGVVIGWAVWQWWSVRRLLREDRQHEATDDRSCDRVHDPEGEQRP